MDQPVSKAKGEVRETAVHLPGIPELGVRSDMLQENEWEENGILKHALNSSCSYGHFSYTRFYNFHVIDIKGTPDVIELDIYLNTQISIIRLSKEEMCFS